MSEAAVARRRRARTRGVDSRRTVAATRRGIPAPVAFVGVIQAPVGGGQAILGLLSAAATAPIEADLGKTGSAFIRLGRSQRVVSASNQSKTRRVGDGQTTPR